MYVIHVVYNGVHPGGYKTYDIHGLRVSNDLGVDGMVYTATHLTLYTSRCCHQDRQQPKHQNHRGLFLADRTAMTTELKVVLVFLAGVFLFVGSDTFAVGCIV